MESGTFNIIAREENTDSRAIDIAQRWKFSLRGFGMRQTCLPAAGQSQP